MDKVSAGKSPMEAKPTRSIVSSGDQSHRMNARCLWRMARTLMPRSKTGMPISMPTCLNSMSRFSGFMIRPRILVSPWSGAIRPPKVLSSVVLPAPFGPIRAMVSPGYALNDMSFRTGFPPIVFDTLLQ